MIRRGQIGITEIPRLASSQLEMGVIVTVSGGRARGRPTPRGGGSAPPACDETHGSWPPARRAWGLGPTRHAIKVVSPPGTVGIVPMGRVRMSGEQG